MAPLLITAAANSTHSLAMFAGGSLAKLTTLDVIVIVIYFAMVIWIGFYLKGQANTSEEFFMAGREMTAWIAGLSFVSANLGSLELMGWAGSAYQYGILAAHWYWIGAIPAMLFLGMVMMPFYYVCKTHSVPGYLKLRYGRGSQRGLGVLVRLHDGADERREHVRHGRGDEGRARLGPELLASSCRRWRWLRMWRWADCARRSSMKCCSSC